MSQMFFHPIIKIKATFTSPGPDGMNALFYQKFWHVVGNNVVLAVLDFLNNGNMLPEIGRAHV